jgi:hypothetical protein
MTRRWLIGRPLRSLNRPYEHGHQRAARTNCPFTVDRNQVAQPQKFYLLYWRTVDRVALQRRRDKLPIAHMLFGQHVAEAERHIGTSQVVKRPRESIRKQEANDRFFNWATSR